MTEKTTRWVPVLELKIEGDDAPAAHALYAKIVAALDDVGVIVEHKDAAAWQVLAQEGRTDPMDADDLLDQISPVVQISCTVQS